MKPSYRSATLFAIAAALAATILWTSWPVGQVKAIQDSEDFPPPFGLAQGQTARLTLLNAGDRAVEDTDYKFLNSRGEVLAQSAARIVIRPGQFRSFDFDLPNPPPGIVDFFGRVQVRAVVSTIGDPDIKNLRVSVEVFDNATGRTSFVIQAPPERD
jgi:hypothetical protein